MFTPEYLSGTAGGLTCYGFPIGGINVNAKNKLRSFKRANAYKNVFAFQNAFANAVTDGIHRYGIDGLPDTIPERHALLSNFWYPCSVLIEKEGGVVMMPACPSGEFNANSDPGKAFAFSYNGYSEEVELVIPGGANSSFLRKNGFGGYMKDGRRAVFIRESEIMYPFVRYAIQYAEAIADTMRTLDVCRKNIKRPYVVFAEESVKPTVEKYFEQRDGNEEYVISSGVFDPNKIVISPIVTNTDSLNSVISMIEWYQSQYRILCGFGGNMNLDKKGENLTTDEIHSGDDYANSRTDYWIRSLNDGFEIANDLFGTSIKAVNRRDKEEVKNAADDFSADKGGDS